MGKSPTNFRTPCTEFCRCSWVRLIFWRGRGVFCGFDLIVEGAGYLLWDCLSMTLLLFFPLYSRGGLRRLLPFVAHSGAICGGQSVGHSLWGEEWLLERSEQGVKVIAGMKGLFAVLDFGCGRSCSHSYSRSQAWLMLRFENPVSGIWLMYGLGDDSP